MSKLPTRLLIVCFSVVLTASVARAQQTRTASEVAESVWQETLGRPFVPGRCSLLLTSVDAGPIEFIEFSDTAEPARWPGWLLNVSMEGPITAINPQQHSGVPADLLGISEAVIRATIVGPGAPSIK